VDNQLDALEGPVLWGLVWFAIGLVIYLAYLEYYKKKKRRRRHYPRGSRRRASRLTLPSKPLPATESQQSPESQKETPTISAAASADRLCGKNS